MAPIARWPRSTRLPQSSVLSGPELVPALHRLDRRRWSRPRGSRARRADLRERPGFHVRARVHRDFLGPPCGRLPEQSLSLGGQEQPARSDCGGLAARPRRCRGFCFVVGHAERRGNRRRCARRRWFRRAAEAGSISSRCSTIGRRARLFDRGARADGYPGEDDYRPDRYTAELALDHLRRHRPRFMLLSLGDADTFGHANMYRRYLEALRESDKVVAETARILAELRAQRLAVDAVRHHRSRPRPPLPRTRSQVSRVCPFLAHRERHRHRRPRLRLGAAGAQASRHRAHRARAVGPRSRRQRRAPGRRWSSCFRPRWTRAPRCLEPASSIPPAASGGTCPTHADRRQGRGGHRGCERNRCGAVPAFRQGARARRRRRGSRCRGRRARRQGDRRAGGRDRRRGRERRAASGRARRRTLRADRSVLLQRRDRDRRRFRGAGRRVAPHHRHQLHGARLRGARRRARACSNAGRVTC